MPLGPIKQLPAQNTPPWEWKRPNVHINDQEQVISLEKFWHATNRRFAVRVYTNGSRYSLSGSAEPRLGVVAFMQANRPMTEVSMKVAMDGKRLDILDMEIEAIQHGLLLCMSGNGIIWKCINLFSDSQVAL